MLTIIFILFIVADSYGTNLQNLNQTFQYLAQWNEFMKNNLRKVVQNTSNDYICVNFCFSMTEEKKKLLTDLEFRVRQVMYMCDTLKAENIRLKSDLQVTQQQFAEKTEQLNQLKTKYDSLKTARTITAASVDVKIAKNKLSKLVREVDKCINLLNS
ncbi:MAG: hypothetical protein VB090_01010 [Petrimonas sp.]|nr:hypothetical protein [Petrimonas sp.]